MPRISLAAFDLKAARKMRGLSQIAVAKILCTTQPSVARWEAQGNMPEVFRKVWSLHWQQEGQSAVHTSARKVNVPNMQTGDKTGGKTNAKRSGSNTGVARRSRRNVVSKESVGKVRTKVSNCKTEGDAEGSTAVQSIDSRSAR